MKRTIPVIGMACSACSANIEKKLNSLNGITSASVSLPSRSALVDFNPDEVSLTDMKAAINAIGYDLVIEDGRSAVEIEKRAYTLLKRKAILSWIFAIGVMAISMHWINLGNNNTSKSGGFACCAGQYAVLWQTVLCFGMETAKEWFGKYGYACCLVYFNSFPIQCFQYILGRSRVEQ